MKAITNVISKSNLKFVYLELTVRCNLSCEFCDKDMKNSYKDIATLQFEEIVDQLLSETKLCLHGIGEPTMHKDLSRFIHYAKSKNLYVYFNTNFTLVSELQMQEFVSSKLDELRISLSAGERGSYKNYSGRDLFDNLLVNIQQMIKIRGTSKFPLVRVVFVLTSENIFELEKVAKICDELGVDELMIQNMQNWGNTTNTHKIKNGVFISNIDNKERKKIFQSLKQIVKHTKIITPDIISDEEIKKGQCQWPFNAIWITANGYITPCCNMHNYNEINFGTAFSNDIYSLWLSESYKNFRIDYLLDKVNACQTCPMHYGNFKTYKYK